MKKLLCVLLSLLCLLPLASCSEDIDESYPTRTAAFYGHMKEYTTFWFEMEFTTPSDTYTFIQANLINEDGTSSTATISKFKDGRADTYEIFDGEMVHTLNTAAKRYDSAVGADGQPFLFAEYASTMFHHPKSTKDATFDGNEYYCETYSTVSGSGEEISGENKYYFDGGTLVAIEIYDGGNRTMVMRFEDYGNKIPNDIYVTPPADYTKGTLTFNSAIDFNSTGWGDWEYAE